MNVDALKKLTTESLDQLAAMLDKGHIERLTSLLATMARFHRYSLHNVCRLCRARHKRHHADSRIMPTTCSVDGLFSGLDGTSSFVMSA